MTDAADRSPYVFISFASEDGSLAHRVVEKLEGSGVRCWISDRDIEPGASYPAAITAAVRQSAALLLLLTGSSSGSPHVLRETELAFSSSLPILPVRVGGATPTPDFEYFLSRSQWFDVGTALDDAECARLAARVRELFRTPRPIPEEERRRKWWIWSAVAAGVLVLFGVVLSLWNRGESEIGDATQAPLGPLVDANTDAGPIAPDTPGVAVAGRTNARDGQVYMWIPPGRFVMGCSAGDPACDKDEQPTHTVAIPRGFWLGRTEVTRAAYRAARTAERTALADEDADLPMAEVSWAGAKMHCTAIGGRLPTEAEWEYAARAGTTTRYYDAPAESAWFEGNADGAPHPVGTKKPNAFGLHDMLGNVSEWVRDRYYSSYDDSSDPAAVEEPLAPNASATARGGSWVSDADGVRVSRRLQMEPDAEEPHIGFRCALDEPGAGP